MCERDETTAYEAYDAAMDRIDTEAAQAAGFERKGKNMGSTKTTQRCIIQEHSADMAASKKRWTVKWTANSDEKPIQFVCRTKAAANLLAATLDNPDVLWASTPKTD